MKLTPLGRFDPFIYPMDQLGDRRRRIFSVHPKKARKAPAAICLTREQEKLFGCAMSIERALGSASEFGTPQQDLDGYTNAMKSYGYEADAKRTFRQHIVETGQFKIERTVRSKSDLDFAFFFGSHQTFGEAYKLAEFSKNRSIVCLDINSMFPWIIKLASFPDPSRLVYREGFLLMGAIMNGTIDNGIFHCHVHYKSEHREFLNRYAPLYFGRHGVSHPISQSEDETFEVLLHACEIVALEPMCEIDVLCGVYSEESIDHPLAGWVDRYYSAKQHGNPYEKIVAKAALTSLHTCTSRVATEQKWLTQDALQAEFLNRFGSTPFTSSRYAQLLEQDDKGAALMSLYRLDNDRNVYSFASTVYAQARVRMLKLLQKLDGLCGATICYSNIDSVHLSVKDYLLRDLIECINDVHGIGPGIGQLKVEAVGKQALWLDAGIYWIADESGKLIKHASIQPDPKKAFALSRRYLTTDPVTKEWTHRRMRLFKTVGISKKLGANGQWERLPTQDFSMHTLAAVQHRLSQQDQLRRAFDRMRHITSV